MVRVGGEIRERWSVRLVLPLVTLAALRELDALGDVLDEEGLLGGDADDVEFGELAVGAADALAGEAQPGAGAGVAVVHEEPALLVLDLRVVGGDALVVELDVRVLRLADAHRVVVLQDRAVGRLVVRLLELELYDALVDVLSGETRTFLMISTLNSTSQDSCTSCSSLSTNGFRSLMYTKVPVLLPRSRRQQLSSLNTICACFPLIDSSSGQLKSFSGLRPNFAPVRLNTLNSRSSSSSSSRSQIDSLFWEELSAGVRAFEDSVEEDSFLENVLLLTRLKGQGMLEILMRWSGSRLSRLKGSCRATAIRVATIESSSIADTAIACSFFFDTCGTSSSMISLLAQTDSLTEARVEPRRLPASDTPTLPRTDTPQSETATLPLSDTPYSEVRMAGPGRSASSCSVLKSPSSETPYCQLWKERFWSKWRSLNSMPKSSRFMSWREVVSWGRANWEQQRWRKRCERRVSSLMSSLEKQFLRVWLSPSLPTMQTRLNPSTPHFFTLSLSSVMWMLRSIRDNCAEPSSITLMLFSFSSSAFSPTIASSAISMAASSSSLHSSSSFLAAGSFSSVSWRIALTTQKSLQRGKQLRSVMMQSRLALRYSASKSLLPSISHSTMISRMLSSTFSRLAKRITCSTDQSILLCFISLISLHRRRMYDLSSSLCRIKLIRMMQSILQRPGKREEVLISDNGRKETKPPQVKKGQERSVLM